MNKISEKEISEAAEKDYQLQTKYDNAYDRQKGFKAGVKWALSILNNRKY